MLNLVVRRETARLLKVNGEIHLLQMV
jgi:hypothetical protein